MNIRFEYTDEKVVATMTPNQGGAYFTHEWTLEEWRVATCHIPWVYGGVLTSSPGTYTITHPQDMRLSVVGPWGSLWNDPHPAPVDSWERK